jgi:hypothetical protein
MLPLMLEADLHKHPAECHGSIGSRRVTAQPVYDICRCRAPVPGSVCRPPVLFKLSVRLQGGPKRAAHAAARARGRRLAVARTDARRQPGGWRAKRGSGRSDDSNGSKDWGLRLGRRPTGAAWTTRPSCRAGPQGESRPSSAGCGDAQCDGPPLQAQGRFASQATAYGRP